MEKTFKGLQEDGVVIINTKKSIKELELPKNAKEVYLVDATGIAIENIKRNIPNTTMLGAFGIFLFIFSIAIPVASTKYTSFAFLGNSNSDVYKRQSYR